MNGDFYMAQIVVFVTLIMTLGLFIWGRIRYDFVSLMALFIVAVFGIIPAEKVFSGFGHAAVITVAAVMIISKGLQNSGLIDLIARSISRLGKGFTLQMIVLCSVTALASAFMNNVGALAIMMPVSIQLSQKNKYPPSRILMPLAFSSLLGGMMTMIGTPPNIIIATLRNDFVGEPFKMFDFAPVGFFLSFIGIVFISFIGWRFIPKRKGESSSEDLFRIEEYITEVRVIKDSKYRGKSLKEIQETEDYEINVLGLIRKKSRIHAPNLSEVLKLYDVLIIEADSKNLKSFVDISGFKLLGGKEFRKDAVGSKDISIREAIVANDSKLIGKTAASINMRSRYGLNLLAVARSNIRFRNRLDQIKFKSGDVLLLQGRTHVVDETIGNIGCIPLAERGLRIGYQNRIVLAVSIFVSAIIAGLTGLITVPVAFSLAALLFVLTNVISFRDVYKDIDWSVIVLLGAMIPVGMALEMSGGAETIAGQILRLGTNLPVWAILGVIMISTMALSNIVNNAATAVLMAPIAIIIAQNIGASIDPFLMTIALGASSPFLTPIGHQSNTLVMGPGGYKFSDYWKVGLPIEIIVILAGIPLIMLFWPV
jgi:di/tricarboxylate transporter